MSDDTWAGLADQFADEAYASVKGYVRTYVMHQQLLEHLPAPPAPVLDVGGGAGHQSFPLAQAGYDVTLLDPSPAMLDKARQRLQRLPGEAQRRVTLLQADGENADEAVKGRRFAAVLCHGVLGYLEQPEPLVDQLCRCAAAGGIVSIMTGNAKAMAVRPALERRWDDALASFDARTEIGVLGVPGRADTVEELSELLQSRGVEPAALVRRMAVRRLARIQWSRVGPQRFAAGGGDGRGRTRSQPPRPLPPTQSRLSSRGTQRSELTGQPQPSAEVSRHVYADEQFGSARIDQNVAELIKQGQIEAAMAGHYARVRSRSIEAYLRHRCASQQEVPWNPPDLSVRSKMGRAEVGSSPVAIGWLRCWVEAVWRTFSVHRMNCATAGLRSRFSQPVRRYIVGPSERCEAERCGDLVRGCRRGTWGSADPNFSHLRRPGSKVTSMSS